MTLQLTHFQEVCAPQLPSMSLHAHVLDFFGAVLLRFGCPQRTHAPLSGWQQVGQLLSN